MSKAEANKTIDQYMNLLENARMEAGKQIDKLEVTLKKAAQEWKEIKHEALVAADKATDAAARSALIRSLQFSPERYCAVLQVPTVAGRPKKGWISDSISLNQVRSSVPQTV